MIQGEVKAGDIVVLKFSGARGILHHSSGARFYFLPLPAGVAGGVPRYVSKPEIERVERHVQPTWDHSYGSTVSFTDRQELFCGWIDGKIPADMAGIL
jgi:hypothetical protein